VAEVIIVELKQTVAGTLHITCQPSVLTRKCLQECPEAGVARQFRAVAAFPDKGGSHPACPGIYPAYIRPPRHLPANAIPDICPGQMV